MESNQDLKEEIAKVAYEIYGQKGIFSSEVENWLEAERIVLQGPVNLLKQPKSWFRPGKRVERGRRKKCHERWSDICPRLNAYMDRLTSVDSAAAIGMIHD